MVLYRPLLNSTSFTTTLGTTSGQNNFGTFTGSIIPNNVSAKVAFQSLETPLEAAKVKLSKIVMITDFGAVPNTNADTTPFLEDAIDYLGADGGIIRFPIGTWKMNATIAQDNIVIVGEGGRGEFDRVCFRPFSLASPTIQFGNGTVDHRYCGLVDVHISGADGTAGADVQAAKNAPQAVLLNGGVVCFLMFNCVLYNGIQTLALIPSLTNPITANKFIGNTLRNDLNDTNDARTLFIQRLNADGGYATANKFIACKFNGPALGYAGEFDGTAYPLLTEINDCYWDIKPGKGIFLKGSSSLTCYNMQLDPGASNVVVIETDQMSKDPARYISGTLRKGDNKMKFGDASELLFPGEANDFIYKGRFSSPFFSDLGYFAPSSTPYSTTIFYDFATDTGPFRWWGTSHQFRDTTQASDLITAGLVTYGGLSIAKAARVGGTLYIYGTNTNPALLISSDNPSGGGYLEAQGTNQNIRLVPSGTGFADVRGTGVKVPSYTVAALPLASLSAGLIVFCTNARNAGEGSGAGTGSLVASDGTNWKIPGIAGAVAA